MNEENIPKNPAEFQQKPIRTYEGDVADVLAHKKISTATMAIAESRKAQGEERIGSAAESSHALKKSLIALLSLVLIGGGAFGAYYLYSISPLAPRAETAAQTSAPASLVPRDAQAVISIDSLNPNSIIAAVRAEGAKPQTPNTIKEIVLAQTQNGQRYKAAPSDMASTMDIGAPDILKRALADDWMLGTYADQAGSKSFFVVASIGYFQNAFAGMLQWESVMPDDLKQYLYENAPADIAPPTPASVVPTAYPINSLSGIEGILPSEDAFQSSTTAATSSKGIASNASASSSQKTSPNKKGSASESASSAGSPQPAGQKPSQNQTSSTTVADMSSTGDASSTSSYSVPSSYTVLHGSFVDRIIKNKDVREFVASDGSVVFLYSFIDNSRLVVTGSEAALSAILDRLEKQSFVR